MIFIVGNRKFCESAAVTCRKAVSQYMFFSWKNKFK